MIWIQMLVYQPLSRRLVWESLLTFDFSEVYTFPNLTQAFSRGLHELQYEETYGFRVLRGNTIVLERLLANRSKEMIE